tara:strand:+ start:227 stop:1870 length:1644 start_codon:yes stop_codon:yes gene_type:complete
MVGANELMTFFKKHDLNVVSKASKSQGKSGMDENLNERLVEVKANFLSLTGGAWFVPDHLLGTFYDIIRRLIIKEIPICIVEVRTDIFKYFIDLDFVSKIAVSIDIIKKICKMIHNCMRQNVILTAGFGLNQYVYTAKPREIDSGEVKTGVHIYYPDIHISSEYALELRKRAIVHLVTNTPELEFINWETVIDPSVYTGSGLRLPHLPKLKKCKCDRLNGDCQNGCNFGVINENGTYRPTFQISNTDEICDLDKLKGNLRQSLALTQIRLNNKQVNVNISLNDRSKGGSLVDDDMNSKKHLYDNLDSKSKRVLNRKQTNFYADNSEILSPDIQQKIETFIKKQWKQYEAIIIRNVKKIRYTASNRSDTYVHYYVNTTSRFCMNIGKEHRSNTIYFIIYISGTSIKVSQRCHCTCDTTHYNATILCKNYSSKSVDIKSNTELYKLLMTSTPKSNSSSDYLSTVAYSWNIDMTADKQNRSDIFNRLTKNNGGDPPEKTTSEYPSTMVENSENSLFDSSGMGFDLSNLDSLINNTKQDDFLSNRIKLNKH